MSADVHPVTFRNRSLRIAGDLWLPTAATAETRLPAVVLATPGSSVKEQIGANYARRLAESGFAALTFDPAYQGQSEGEPRDLEDPAVRVEDLRCAVDFFMTHETVDPERVAMLGVCAGGGYAVQAAMTDHRVKALGTVTAVNIGRARRQGNPSSPSAAEDLLDAVSTARTLEARTGEQTRQNWIPDTVEAAQAAGITDRDVLDAIDFYRTPRGLDEHSTNRRYVPTDAPMIAFDAFHLADELLTQPVQVIVGGRRGSTGAYEDGLLLWEKVRNKQPLIVIDGAGHYDLYDKPEYVDPAVDGLVRFYAAHL